MGGLIDEGRLYSVMNKVKGMANQSKMINYREVCAYTNEINQEENFDAPTMPNTIKLVKN